MNIVFENLYSINIETITASFEGQPSLTFNGTDTYFCSNLDLDLFNELIIIFNSLKQNIISKICMQLINYIYKKQNNFTIKKNKI